MSFRTGRRRESSKIRLESLPFSAKSVGRPTSDWYFAAPRRGEMTAALGEFQRFFPKIADTMISYSYFPGYHAQTGKQNVALFGHSLDRLILILETIGGVS
jgi:hypothetical protein